MKARRFVYLAAGVFAVAGFLLMAGPAGASRQIHATAATNVACGDTIHVSITLNGDLDCSTYSGTSLTIDRPGVTLNLGGFTITGNSSYEVIYNYGCTGSVGCNNFTVTNGTINGGTNGVDSEGSSSQQVAGTTVSSLRFIGQHSEAILFEYTANGTISNNSVTDTGDHSIYAIDDEYSSNDYISGNTLTGYSNAASNSGYGIYFYYTAGAVVVNNTVTAWGDEGLYDDNYSAGLLIYGNVFAGNYTGIYLDGNDNGDTLSGNYVKNSSSYGIKDEYSNFETYTGNVVSSNGDQGFYLYPDSDGVFNASNNVSRFNSDEGFYIYEAYNDYAYGGPTTSVAGWNMITGNTAFKNGSYGFYDDYSVGETWKNNTAQANSDSGFYFDYPMGATITSNTSKDNINEGFDFEDNYSYYGPASVANNVAQYNTDYGFYGDYPVPGSGNTGSGTNSTADCYQFTGCS